MAITVHSAKGSPSAVKTRPAMEPNVGGGVSALSRVGEGSGATTGRSGSAEAVVGVGSASGVSDGSVVGVALLSVSGGSDSSKSVVAKAAVPISTRTMTTDFIASMPPNVKVAIVDDTTAPPPASASVPSFAAAALGIAWLGAAASIPPNVAALTGRPRFARWPRMPSMPCFNWYWMVEAGRPVYEAISA